MNKGRKTEADHVVTPDEILNHKYRKSATEVALKNHDPDRGAAGDWKGLKRALQGTTTEAGIKRAKRPRAMM